MRKCCVQSLLPLFSATLDMVLCLSIPLPHPHPAPQLIAHLSIARNVPGKPRLLKRGGRNEHRKIKVIVGLHDQLLSKFPSSLAPSHLPAESDFHFSSGLPLHSDEHQHHHDTSAIAPPLHRVTVTSLLPCWVLLCILLTDNYLAFHSFSAENTLLVYLFNARSFGTSRRSSDISMFILDNNISIMLLMEIWQPLLVLRPRSPTWLRLNTQFSPSPALQADQALKAGASPLSWRTLWSSMFLPPNPFLSSILALKLLNWRLPTTSS